MTVRVAGVAPLRACFRPGEPWQFRVTVSSSEPASALLRIRACWPGGPGAGRQGADGGTGRAGTWAVHRARLAAGVTELSCELPSPPSAERGYLVEAVIDSDAGTGTGYGAADVLNDWRDDPRYGFLSEFAPGDTGQAARAAWMAGLHLNCAQFYDWAYRHDRLLPPGPRYRDPMGRRLSLDSVRASISACADAGIASLGYAALYAGLPDFAAAHPDWRITDGGGAPEHLAGLFCLMNPGDPGWRAHLLGQLGQALDTLPFGGFHLDQYGYPRTAWDSSGRPVDVGAGLAGLASAASALVAGRRPDGGVIANAVGGWPAAEFAAVPQLASYIEVWPPHTRYEDLVALADLARQGARRPVILAAYPAFLGVSPRPAPGLASGGLGLLTAVILAAGGWPLLAGEAGRVLADPYYPRHVAPPAAAMATLTGLLRFGVVFRDWLRGPLVRSVEPAFLAGPAAEWDFSTGACVRPEAGSVWARASTTPGWTVLSLVSLRGVTDVSWDRPQPHARPGSVTVTLPRHLRRPACWAASPRRGLERLPVMAGPGGRYRVRVPVRLWTLLGIADESAR